jgi:hypothetical protein
MPTNQLGNCRRFLKRQKMSRIGQCRQMCAADTPYDFTPK